ncbi:hypothetical protein F5Y12DRAFT_733028 [Xylaria sp. FL1777]|nr:hypothetical protein F5Y12DRAFT_733028 [Xylaria sp. FL1777]
MAKSSKESCVDVFHLLLTFFMIVWTKVYPIVCSGTSMQTPQSSNAPLERESEGRLSMTISEYRYKGSVYL